MQDFTGKFGSKQSTYDKPDLPEARLSAVWFAVPGAVVGACLLAPLGVRALARRLRRPPPEPLPPLPRSLGR
jgi:hypothetical protein